MGKPLNAFGIYSAERSPNCHFLPLGAEGYLSDSLKPSLVNAVELSDEKMRAKLIALAPCGRLGIADDVAGLAVFLASDDVDYCVGGFYAVDGGLMTI